MNTFNIVKSLQWRHAIKSFKPIPQGHKVDISSILEAIRLSPSAMGAQPYNIHIVSDPELKKKLREVSFNQAQVTDCSHLLIFCARNDPNETIERFIQHNNLDTIAQPYAKSLRTNQEMNSTDFLNWSTAQSYIGLGIGVAAAAALKIGHCPMSGFNALEVKKVVKLPENQFPVAYLAIGSEFDEGMDKETERKKFRLSHELLYTEHI